MITALYGGAWDRDGITRDFSGEAISKETAIDLINAGLTWNHPANDLDEDDCDWAAEVAGTTLRFDTCEELVEYLKEAYLGEETQMTAEEIGELLTSHINFEGCTREQITKEMLDLIDYSYNGDRSPKEFYDGGILKRLVWEEGDPSVGISSGWVLAE